MSEIQVTNQTFKLRDGFEMLDPELWYVKIGQGDLIEEGGNTVGSSYVKISKSNEIMDTETTLTSKFALRGPFRMALAMSLSQRIQFQRFSMELVGTDEYGNIVRRLVPNDPVAISTMSQTTTTLTITTTAPHNCFAGERILINGSSDSRLNYGECMVASVLSSTQLTVTSTVYAGLPSLTAGPVTTGTIQKIDVFDYADNGYGIIWEGQSANNGKIANRSARCAILVSGDIWLGTGHTNAIVGNATAFSDSFQPSYMYDIRFKNEGIVTRTFSVDSGTGQSGSSKRNQIIPEAGIDYHIRIRAKNISDGSRVVGRIVSAVKSASTTATITTTTPHGLSTGDFVGIMGIRDVTNFAAQITGVQVASVIDTTTFTCVFGASATATSYGGVVYRICGGQAIPQAIPQAVQTIARTDNTLVLTGNTNWTGLIIGDTVDLFGITDTLGVNFPNYEGTYRIVNIATTTLVLSAPGANFGALNVGGAVVKRTDLRLHFMRAHSYLRHTVDIDSGNGNISDAQEAIPVSTVNTVSASVVSWSGQTAHDAVIASNPFRIGGRALTSNYAAVASGDTADLITTLVGALIHKPYSIPEMDWTYTAAVGGVINTTDVVIKAAAGAGIRNYVTGFTVNNVAAVASEYVIKDGTTVIYRGYLPASMAAGETAVIFPTPLRSTANAAINFALLTTGTQTYFNAQGYAAP